MTKQKLFDTVQRATTKQLSNKYVKYIVEVLNKYNFEGKVIYFGHYNNTIKIALNFNENPGGPDAGANMILELRAGLKPIKLQTTSEYGLEQSEDYAMLYDEILSNGYIIYG